MANSGERKLLTLRLPHHNQRKILWSNVSRAPSDAGKGARWQSERFNAPKVLVLVAGKRMKWPVNGQVEGGKVKTRQNLPRFRY